MYQVLQELISINPFYFTLSLYLSSHCHLHFKKTQILHSINFQTFRRSQQHSSNNKNTKFIRLPIKVSQQFKNFGSANIPKSSIQKYKTYNFATETFTCYSFISHLLLFPSSSINRKAVFLSILTSFSLIAKWFLLKTNL